MPWKVPRRTQCDYNSHDVSTNLAKCLTKFIASVDGRILRSLRLWALDSLSPPTSFEKVEDIFPLPHSSLI